MSSREYRPDTIVVRSTRQIHFKGDKNVPRKGVDDKRQITATFGISLTAAFLPMQLIYASKTKRCLPKFTFPDEFHVTSTVLPQGK